MGFKIVVDGEAVHEVEDRRVIKVHIFTKRGESGTIGIEADETDIALAFEYAPLGVIMLDDVDKLKPGYKQNLDEGDLEEQEKALAEVRPNENVGQDQFTTEAIEAREEAKQASNEQQAKGGLKENPVDPGTNEDQPVSNAGSIYSTHDQDNEDNEDNAEHQDTAEAPVFVTAPEGTGSTG